MKKLTTLILFIILSISTFAQVPNFQWAKSVGGPDLEFIEHMTTDASGNVIVAGYFYSALITFGNTTLTNVDPGTGDIFIVKYDTYGNVIWAKRVGGLENDNCFGITSDKNENIYLTGYFTKSIILGTDTLIDTSLNRNNSFLTKLDLNGNVITSKKLGVKFAYSLVLDNLNNVYITGTFDTPVYIFGLDTLINHGDANSFLAKFDSNLNENWANSIISTRSNFANTIKIDSNGDIIISGTFGSDSLVIGNDTLINKSYGVNYNQDIYIVKYDSLGNTVWAKSAGGIGNEIVSSISMDRNGNVILIGYFDSHILSVGNINLTNTTSDGSTDIYIIKYSHSGALLWAKRIGGTLYEVSRNIITDSLGNSYIVGWFVSTIINIGNTTLINAAVDGTPDIFIFKIDILGNVLWAKKAGGTGEDVCYDIVEGTNGNIYVGGGFSSSSITFGSTTLNNVIAGGSSDIFLTKLSLCEVPQYSYPINHTASINQSTGFSVHLNNSKAKYQWQSDIGFGFQNLSNAGQYNGVTTDSLSISNLSMINNNQYFRCSITLDTCGITFISDPAKLTVNNTVGINTVNHSNINIYPNPTNNNINIEGLPEHELTPVNLFNTQGKLVLSKELPSSGIIDLSSFSQGVYVIKIGEVVQRVVKL